MDAKEFKAWFEGFCEGVGDTPTAEQWAKLKQKVGTLAVPLDNLNLLPQYPQGQRVWRDAMDEALRANPSCDARPFPPQVYAQRAEPSCEARVVNDR